MNKNNPYQATAVEHEPKRKNHFLVIALAVFVAVAVLFGIAGIRLKKQAQAAEDMAQEARKAAVQLEKRVSRAQQELTPAE